MNNAEQFASASSMTPMSPVTTATATATPSSPFGKKKMKRKHRASPEELELLSALSAMNNIERYVSSSSSKTNVPFRDRVSCSIAMFLAELIVQICEPPDIDAYNYNKVNRNIVNIDESSNNVEWPEIWPDNSDIHLGPMNSQEVCVCMLRWALDGRVSNNLLKEKRERRVKAIFKASKEQFKVIMEHKREEIAEQLRKNLLIKSSIK